VILALFRYVSNKTADFRYRCTGPLQAVAELQLLICWQTQNSHAVSGVPAVQLRRSTTAGPKW
jgi:hypothetical protein